jgi:hypothetical protein
MNLKHNFVLLSFLFFCSCSSLFLQKTLFGVKNPKFISKEKVVDFLNKHNFNSTNLYGISSSGYIEAISNNRYILANIKLFNEEGCQIESDSTTMSCYGTIADFLSDLSNSNKTISTNKNFDNQVLINKITTLDGNPTSRLSTQGYDYTLVIFWASFMGKHSIDVLELEKSFFKN